MTGRSRYSQVGVSAAFNATFVQAVGTLLHQLTRLDADDHILTGRLRLISATKTRLQLVQLVQRIWPLPT